MLFVWAKASFTHECVDFLSSPPYAQLPSPRRVTPLPALMPPPSVQPLSRTKSVPERSLVILRDLVWTSPATPHVYHSTTNMSPCTCTVTPPLIETLPHQPSLIEAKFWGRTSPSTYFPPPLISINLKVH